MQNVKGLLILLALSFSLTSLQAEDALNSIKVERAECLSFPKFLDMKQAKEGLQYTLEEEESCDDDYENCSTHYEMNIKYIYVSVKNFDYYSNEGKLITTEAIKTSHVINDGTVAYSTYSNPETMWKEITDSIRETISTKIYEHSSGACETSFYRD